MSRPERPAARSPDVGCSVAWNFGCRDVAGLALVAIWWWSWIVVQVSSPQPISSATRYPSRPIACSSAAPEIRRHPSPHPNSTRASTPPHRSPPSPTGCATSPRSAVRGLVQLRVVIGCSTALPPAAAPAPPPQSAPWQSAQPLDCASPGFAVDPPARPPASAPLPAAPLQMGIPSPCW